MILHAEKVADDGENVFLRVRKPYTEIKGEILVEVDNGEHISAAQRRKIYKLLRYISTDTGYTSDETLKEMLKLEFTAYTGKVRRIFSLANCSKETASEFISFLIDFCLNQGIACDEPLQSLCEDMERYMYACLMGKKCCVCGKPADLHHYDAIGRRNRRQVYQIGMLVMPLCREHHTEMHTKENMVFRNKYHVQPVPLTVKVGKVYNLTRANLEEG